jgi:hypothetical protein
MECHHKLNVFAKLKRVQCIRQQLMVADGSLNKFQETILDLLYAEGIKIIYERIANELHL